jgi:carbohydrate-selective porin OprB
MTELKHKYMKYLITFLFFISSILFYGQVYSSDYTSVIDYDGQTRRVYNYVGNWTYSDSTLVQTYENGRLEYNVSRVNGRYVYYINDSDEEITIVFSINGDVIMKCALRPNNYVIFRKTK